MARLVSGEMILIGDASSLAALPSQHPHDAQADDTQQQCARSRYSGHRHPTMIVATRTAAGLAAAIPAVIGYNHFLGKLRAMDLLIDEFIADFIHRIQGRRG